MKWSEVYSKCNNKENSIVETVKQPLQLVSNFKFFIQKYGLPLTLVIAIFLVLIIITYKFNIQIILACLAVILFTLIVLIYNNTYKIEIRRNKVNINMVFQELSIKYEDFVTVFISRRKKRIMMIPFYFYNLNIIYLDNEEQQELASFPTIMLKPEDVINFFKAMKIRIIELPESK